MHVKIVTTACVQLNYHITSLNIDNTVDKECYEIKVLQVTTGTYVVTFIMAFAFVHYWHD